MTEKNSIMMGCTCGKIDLERKVLISKSEIKFADHGQAVVTLPHEAIIIFRCVTCGAASQFENTTIEYRENDDI